MIPFQEKSNTIWLMLKSFCIGFFLFCTSISALWAENNWTKQGDLSKKWYVYSPAWKTYLPYVSSKHFTYQSKSLIFEASKSYGSYIEVQPKETYHLFVNGVYRQAFAANKLYRINIDSLLQTSRQDYVVFTLFNKQLKGLPDRIEQVVPTQTVPEAAANFFELLSRPTSILNNFFLVGTLLVLFLFAWIYRYFPRNFSFFFRFTDWFSFTYKEDSVVKTIFSFPNLVILFGVSLLIAYVSFYQTYLDPIELEQLKVGSSQLEWTVIVWFIFKNALLAFVLFLSRYVGYLIFTSLFKMEILATPHFLKSIQTNVQFYCLLFLILFLLFLLGGPTVHPSIEQITFAINTYLLVRMAYFFVLFKRTFHLNSLTLAVYLIFLEGQAILFGIRHIIFPNSL